MRRANVELHIEELVLHGFDNVDRSQLGAAVQQQLTWLFEERGVPPSLATGNNRADLDGGEFRILAAAKVQAIAVQIAQNIYARFNR